jgi:hypothetical protein
MDTWKTKRLDIEELKPKVEEASAKLADAKRGREEVEGIEETRASKLACLDQVSKKKTAIETELASLKENDPAASGIYADDSIPANSF